MSEEIKLRAELKDWKDRAYENAATIAEMKRENRLLSERLAEAKECARQHEDNAHNWRTLAESNGVKAALEGLEQFKRQYHEGAADLLARAEADESRVKELEESIARHFHSDHLAGDGPEIDRWKSRAAALEAERDAIREAAKNLMAALDTIDKKSPAKSCPFQRRALKAAMDKKYAR